jgi:hypothetical protein
VVGLAEDRAFDGYHADAVLNRKQGALGCLLWEKRAAIREATQGSGHRMEGVRLNEPLFVLKENRIHARLAVSTWWISYTRNPF